MARREVVASLERMRVVVGNKVPLLEEYDFVGGADIGFDVCVEAS